MIKSCENMPPEEEYGPPHNLSPSERLIVERLDAIRPPKEPITNFPVIYLMAATMRHVPPLKEYASDLDISAIIYQAKLLAEEDIKQFKLEGEDSTALKLLYLGFTQTIGLQTQGDVFYCAHITRAERSQETRFSLGHNNEALWGESTDRRLYTDRAFASKPVWNAIMSRFSILRSLEGLNVRFSDSYALYGTQLRYRPPNTIWARPLAI